MIHGIMLSLRRQSSIRVRGSGDSGVDWDEAAGFPSSPSPRNFTLPRSDRQIHLPYQATFTPPPAKSTFVAISPNLVRPSLNIYDLLPITRLSHIYTWHGFKIEKLVILENKFLNKHI